MKKLPLRMMIAKSLGVKSFTFKAEAHWLVLFGVLLPVVGILFAVIIPYILRALAR